VKIGWVLRASAAIAVRPGLWAIAVTQVFVLARHRWWRTAPFLPVPDRAYLRFRLQTMYGDADRAPDPRDVVTYLHWCQTMRAV
jgi:hypothetical protein